MKDDERVLDAIKRFGPLSAYGLSIILKLPEERGVRSAISSLRKKGERIWNDADRQAFWWADDVEPDATPQTRWKRAWTDNSGMTASSGLERARMFLDAASECE
jgi:hypothetical protein